MTPRSESELGLEPVTDEERVLAQAALTPGFVIGMLREIEALSKDLAAEWKRNDALLQEAARLQGVIEGYQKFGGINVQPGTSNGTNDGA